MAAFRTVNNPERVPPLLAAIDRPQEGLPRVIHPVVGAPVGRPDPEVRTVDQSAEYVTIDEDRVLTDDQGVPRRFKAGARLHPHLAARYPGLGVAEPDYVAGASNVRPEEEVPDVAETERRAQGAAPQNRAERPAQNRARRADPARPAPEPGNEG